MTSILDYIDEYIERKRMTLNDYPASLVLTQATVDKIKVEIDKQADKFDMCWGDTFPSNYRGIPIEIGEQDVFAV